MSAAFLALGIGTLVGLAVWAWLGLVEEADANSGQPPTLRPDPLDEFAETWDQRAADERILATVREYEREQAVIYDRLKCDEIERAEGWL